MKCDGAALQVRSSHRGPTTNGSALRAGKDLSKPYKRHCCTLLHLTRLPIDGPVHITPALSEADLPDRAVRDGKRITGRTYPRLWR